MNEKKGNRIYNYIFLALAFIFTFGIGSYSGISSTMDNPKDIPAKAGVPAAASNEANWRALKLADDRIIASCSDNFHVVSEIFDAQANADLATVEKKNVQLRDGADDAARLADERNAALKNLGY